MVFDSSTPRTRRNLLIAALGGTAAAAAATVVRFDPTAAARRVRLGRSRSGVATIPAGATQTTVNPGVKVRRGSVVMLTPVDNNIQAPAGANVRAVWYTLNGAQKEFVIHLDPQRSADTDVAWLFLSTTRRHNDDD